jgi:arylsulfatase A
MTMAVSCFGQERPNIILIYADDVGYGDLGCYGAEAIDTPNLDALAAGGMRFTGAYATASTCTPSRYSLLTGEYAFRNEAAIILPGNAPLIIDPTKPTLASVLKAAGYRTGLVGKWHLGLGTPSEALDWNGEIAPGPRELGFEYSFHMAATGDRVPTVYIRNGRVVDLDLSDPIEVSYTTPIPEEPTGLSHPHLLRTQADEQHAKTIVDGTSRIGWMRGGEAARWTDEEMPDTFLAEAIHFIEREKDGPFFLYYATHENHVPRVPHPRFVGSSGLGVRGDAVVQLDWSVGEIIAALKRAGIQKDTLVIFSSDNGPVLYDGYYDGALEKNGSHRAAGPWRGGKYSVWEGGTRLPLIASWPARIRPGLSDALISQVDFVATLSKLAGAEVPGGSARDSLELGAVLLGETGLGRDHLIQQGVGMTAIRSGPWKYLPEGIVRERGGVGRFIQTSVQRGGALYYLPEDPEERNNVASKYPGVAERLRKLLVEQTGADATGGKRRNELGGAVSR